jgi:hypothetical protein
MHFLPLTLALTPLAVSAQIQADGESVTQLLDSARLWEIKQRDDLARLALEKLLRAAPDNREAIARLAALDARAGQAGPAMAALARLQAANPNDAAVRELQTQLRLLGPDRAKLAEVRLMARSGRSKEAAQAYRDLFPEGVPDGPLALEYYRNHQRNPRWPARGLGRLCPADENLPAGTHLPAAARSLAGATGWYAPHRHPHAGRHGAAGRG